MIDKNRIAKNTAVLYLGMVVAALLSLISVRFILENLGVEDYGVYLALAGVVGFLNILNSIMSSGTQRFLSFEHGKGEGDSVNVHFNAAMTLHVVTALLIILSGLALKDYVVHQLMNLPVDRLETATFIYDLVLIKIAVSVLGVPYSAVLNAREDFRSVTLISILQSAMMFFGAWSLYIVSYDKLAYYTIITTFVMIAVFVLQLAYVRSNYPESAIVLRHLFNHRVVRSQVSFSAWNLFGALASIVQNQGMVLLINIFFGPAVNAVFGIAQQVSRSLTSFSSTLMRAIRPQLIQAEGRSDRRGMLNLVNWSGRVSFYVLLFLVAPLLLNMELIFRLWLGNIPEGLTLFTALVIVGALINQFSVGIMSGVQAVGKIATYQAVVGLFLVMPLPLGYIAFSLGYPAGAVLIIAIIIALLAIPLRVWFAHRIFALDPQSWYKETVLMALIGVAPALTASWAILHLIGDYSYLHLLGIIAPIILIPMNIYVAGLTQSEKVALGAMLRRALAIYRTGDWKSRRSS